MLPSGLQYIGNFHLLKIAPETKVKKENLLPFLTSVTKKKKKTMWLE